MFPYQVMYDGGVEKQYMIESYDRILKCDPNLSHPSYCL